MMSNDDHIKHEENTIHLARSPNGMSYSHLCVYHQSNEHTQAENSSYNQVYIYAD